MVQVTTVGGGLCRKKAIRTPGKKLMEKTGTKLIEMYSLVDDPLEKRNLADTDQRLDFIRLDEQLQEWKKSMAAYEKNRPLPKVKVDERVLQQIRSLGYVH